MLEKIFTLKNLGLFKSGTPDPALLGKVTLIYGENGRGKSTLVSALRDSSERETNAVLARKTLGETTPPEIGLLFQVGAVSFSNGVWTGSTPRIDAFDLSFVERNVYSGSVVRPDQRQALLDFALGDDAVGMKREIEQLTDEGRAATGRRTAAERTLDSHRGEYSRTDFLQLALIPDVAVQIEAKQGEISRAKQQETLQKRPALALLAPVTMDLDDWYGTLSSTLESMESEAERKVQEHFAQHHVRGFQKWVGDGFVYLDGTECPFCGQGIDGVALIQAYRSYFNEAFSNHKEGVADLVVAASSALTTDWLGPVGLLHSGNMDRVEVWSDQLQLSEIPLDQDSLSSVWESLKAELGRLVDQKRESPLEAIGTDEQKAAIKISLSKINDTIATYNANIETLNKKIADFKSRLGQANLQSLESQLKALQASKHRHSDAVGEIVEELASAKADQTRIENRKGEVRQSLDSLMATTLGSFGDSINTWLQRIGADFRIIQLRPNYQGGSGPRADYALSIQNTEVALVSSDPATPSFATTLSEGDKRSLAFAFFMAKQFGYSDLDQRVVVVDDPATSLDRNRRQQTVEALLELAGSAGQLIVVSHDAFFLRELYRNLRPAQHGTHQTLQVVRSGAQFSVLEPSDIERICEGDYHRRLTRVVRFVEEGSLEPGCDVASDLRVLVEGDLHRRFPVQLNSARTLGQVIEFISRAQAPNPLSLIQPLLPQLNALNVFSSRDHHASDPSPDPGPPSDAEILGYARRCLNFLRTGTF